MVSIIKRAEQKDLEQVTMFLENAKLNTTNVRECLSNFLLLVDEHNSIKATIGLDFEKNKGLIRSLVLLPTVTQSELIYLIEHMLLLAKEVKVEEVYLLTRKSTNAQLFHFFDFEETNLSNEVVPLLIKNGYELEGNVCLYRKKVNNGYNLSTI